MCAEKVTHPLLDIYRPPVIKSIKVEKGRIMINADNYYGNLWISDGEVVATGNTLPYTETDGGW